MTEIMLKDVKPNEVFSYGKHKYYVTSIAEDNPPFGNYFCECAEPNYNFGRRLFPTDIVEVER